MKFVQHVTVLCFVICILTSQSMGDEPKRRQKRYLRFIEGSKYFGRILTKHNVIPWFRVIGQAAGFRVNFEAPKKLRGTRHKIARRDLYQNLETLIMQHGFDGRACILKSLCEASKIITPQSGILLKLYKKIFTFPEGDDVNYPYLKSEECDVLGGHCPLSILNMAKFTDV